MSAAHHPDLMAQHADVMLADGTIVGFYGEGDDRSGNGIGLNMNGVVYDRDAMRIQRPYYVDADAAIANRVVSTVLLIKVTRQQARRFAESWDRMTRHPGSFNIVGGNCSTHASASFIDAGVLPKGIPGLDTPDRLYAQIVDTLPAASLQSVTGFVGILPAPRGGFDLVVKPYVDTPATNRPNPGWRDSLSTQSW